eukprot:m.1184515 g.1184515  ORF g.1184515 m.1184515 type:complete len:111 (+) comp24541_c0_seq41:650-982(+)
MAECVCESYWMPPTNYKHKNNRSSSSGCEQHLPVDEAASGKNGRIQRADIEGAASCVAFDRVIQNSTQCTGDYLSRVQRMILEVHTSVFLNFPSASIGLWKQLQCQTRYF